VIRAIVDYVDGALGEISVPIKPDGNCGSVRITRRTSINQPTKEKIESALAVIAADVGNPALAQHLHAVIALMRASQSWDQFKSLLNRAFPRRGDTLALPFMSEGGASA